MAAFFLYVGGNEIWQFPIMLCGKYYGCNNAVRK